MSRSAVVIFLSLIAAANAQESRGTIAGRVTDPQNHGVPQVKLVITKAGSGVAIGATTNDQGSYGVPLLLPGRYRIATSHTGFKSFRRDGVELRVNGSLQIDIALEIGTVSETMSVTDTAPRSTNVGRWAASTAQKYNCGAKHSMGSIIRYSAARKWKFNSGFGQITATANYARQIQAVLRVGF